MTLENNFHTGFALIQRTLLPIKDNFIFYDNVARCIMGLTTISTTGGVPEF